MNANEIGNIGEAKALMKFSEFGIPVYLPFGNGNGIDMIININNRLFKIQVKTSEVIDRGCAEFHIFSSTRNSGGHKRKVYTDNDIDYFVLYSVPLDMLFLVHVNDAPDTKIRIRIADPLCNNNRIRNADEYIFDDVIINIINLNV